MPLVSIITPAYKCKDTFADTFNSIISQTFSNWEWLIVEDNSNDGTFDFIKNLIKNDKRIKLYQTQKNSGAATARNVAIQNAIGKYIAFIDADDLWLPNKLEKQLAFMQENSCLFSCTDYDLLYENGKRSSYKLKKNRFTYRNLLTANAIGCLTVMYDSEKIGKVFMPLDCEKREDHGAWLDITKKNIVAYKLPECLSIYRVSNSSVSASKIKMFKYQFQLYRKHEKFGILKSFWYTCLLSLKKIFSKY